jgi:F-type H+-transporting ATPase subunit b
MTILAVSMIAIIIVVFVILVAYMQKVFKGEVSSATSHLDSLASEYAKKEEAINKQFEDVKRQSQEIIENAKKDAELQKENILRQTQEEQNKMVAEAQAKAAEMIQQADNARLALLAELEEKINERSVVKALQLLCVALPENIRSEIHQRWVDDLISNSFEQLDRLKVPDDVKEAKVTSAFALNQKQKLALAAKIKEKLGYEVTLIEEKDPSIIAGLVVSIGGLFLDGSLKFKIQEAARGRH